MFKCSSCDYTSNRKYNLQKHIKSIHNRDATDGELTKVVKNTQITAETTQMTVKPTQITAKTTQITAKNTQITAKKYTNNSQFLKNIFACQKCFKIFKTSHGFKNHQSICKGVSNALECHFCHKVFIFQQSKHKHLKTCKIKKAQQEVKEVLHNIENQNHNIITNNTNTNNANNQQIIYNINNYRISNDDFYSKYNINDEDVSYINDFGKEDISYIPTEQMHDIALYCDFKTLINKTNFNPEHPENHNIRLNCNKSYKVLKNKKWEVEAKETVCSEIYNNTKKHISNYAYLHLLDSELDEKQSEEYLAKWQQYDKLCKKNMFNYIEIKHKDIMKEKLLLLTNKNSPQMIMYTSNEVLAIE